MQSSFILYILPFGLVRLRTFRLVHGLVRCNINAGVHACTERMCDSEIKIPDRNWDQGCEWRHAPEASTEIWEKAVSWVPASKQEGWDSELSEARRICTLWVPRIGWVESWRCKSSQHRKTVSLSPHVKNPLNSKRWIKVLYLNQFRVFGFPMSISHIRISGYAICSNMVSSIPI